MHRPLLVCLVSASLVAQPSPEPPAVHAFAEPGYAPRFSPDGKSIAFIRGGRALRAFRRCVALGCVLAKGLIADLPTRWT